jgi:hypothetical protein
MGYHVLRKGDVFKIIYMDERTASLWENEGWETLRYDSNDQACAAMSDWKTIDTPKIESSPDASTGVDTAQTYY